MRVVRINKFLEEKETVNWLVADLLPDVGWSLFYGLKGIGKTTFALQLCAALQGGTDFLERKTKQTSILYIQADSVTIEWREIVRRIIPKGNTGFTAVDVPSKALSNKAYVDRLAYYISVVKPGFVVFDSLYKLTSRNINNEGILLDIDTMIELCTVSDVRIPWLLIHHPPHGENRAAGHSSLAAACSNEWALTKTRLTIPKGRLVPFTEMPLKRNKEGLWELHKSSSSVNTGKESYMDREL